VHASPERSGACYRLAGKKAEAEKTRRKTLFPVLGDVTRITKAAKMRKA
jgi:hypothetical protein